MLSKCINSTSDHKYITENGFNNTDFLYDLEILAARRCFSPILTTFHCAMRMRSFDHITTSGLKSDVIFEFSASVFLRASDAIFGDFCDDNDCTWAVSTLILLPVANLSPEINSVTPSSYKTRIFRL